MIRNGLSSMRGRQSESDAFSVGEHCKSSTSALLPYPGSSQNRLSIFSSQSLIPQTSRPYLPALEAAGYKLTIQEPDCHQHRPFKGPDININLHVFTTGSTEVDRVLMLRDWLQKNPSDPISSQRTRRATTQLTTTTAKVAQLPSRITTPAFHLQSSQARTRRTTGKILQKPSQFQTAIQQHTITTTLAGWSRQPIPDGSYKTVSFNDAALVESDFDENGHRTDYLYDSLHRLVGVRQYYTSVFYYLTTYSYDGRGNLVRVADANGDSWSLITLIAQTREQTSDTHPSHQTKNNTTNTNHARSRIEAKILHHR